MILRRPKATRADKIVPYTTLLRCTGAVTQAGHEGAKAIICASTGNTAAAAAAYAVRAGITAVVLITDGKIAIGKLAQAVVHGAVVIQIQGNFDDGMRPDHQIGETTPVAIVN